MFFSESSSSLTAIHNIRIKNLLIIYILEIYNTSYHPGKSILFVSHIGILANDIIDSAAKAALTYYIALSTVPFTDFKPLTYYNIHLCWQGHWTRATGDKLHSGATPLLHPPLAISSPRRGQVAACRQPTGHQSVTRAYRTV